MNVVVDPQSLLSRQFVLTSLMATSVMIIMQQETAMTIAGIMTMLMKVFR
jgi:hypothetical protein